MSDYGSDWEQELKKKVPPATTAPFGDEARAQKEQQQIEKAAGEHKRDVAIRNIIGLGMNVLVGVIFVIIIVAVGTLGYHLLVPIKYHWLDSGELQNVKDFVLSGTIVGLGTRYFWQYLEAKQK